MQGACVVARIVLGWLADRTGRPAWNLTVQAFLCAAVLAGYGLLPHGAPRGLELVAAVAAGFLGASWNGIYMAEVARLSPPEKIADATFSSTLFTFLGYVAGPFAFSWLVTWTRGWTVPFLLVALQLAAMAAAQTVFMLHRAMSAARFSSRPAAPTCTRQPRRPPA
jgi:MFS family permease